MSSYCKYCLKNSQYIYTFKCLSFAIVGGSEARVIQKQKSRGTARH